MTDNVGVTVQLGEERIKFYLQILSLSAEERMRQALYGLTDEEKETKSYALHVGYLSEFEAQKAEKITFDEKGEEIVSPIEVKEYFSEKTGIKSRIVEYAVRGWLLKVVPDVYFS